MTMVCEYCNNSFANKTSLYIHQRKAKYCLEHRGKELEKFECQECHKKFTEKRYLEKHDEKCNKTKYITILEEQLRKKDAEIVTLNSVNTAITKKLIQATQQNIDNQIISTKYEEQIERLEKQIKDLQNSLKDVAVQGVKKSTTTNILKLQPLTKEWLDAQALLLTNGHLSQGAAGLAQFAVDNSFKDRVVCTDVNRKSLRYKADDGKVSKDPKGKKLSKMFFESIKSKADDILPNMMEKIKQELDDVGEEPEVLDAVMSKMTELINVEKGIKQITKGQEHELKEEFTRQLCELLPNP